MLINLLRRWLICLWVGHWWRDVTEWEQQCVRCSTLRDTPWDGRWS